MSMGCKYLNQLSALADLSPFLRDWNLGTELSLPAPAPELMCLCSVLAAEGEEGVGFPCHVGLNSPGRLQPGRVQFEAPPCLCLYEVFVLQPRRSMKCCPSQICPGWEGALAVCEFQAGGEGRGRLLCRVNLSPRCLQVLLKRS